MFCLCDHKFKYQKISSYSKIKKLSKTPNNIFYLETIKTENHTYFYFIIYDKINNTRKLKLLLSLNSKPYIMNYYYNIYTDVLEILFSVELPSDYFDFDIQRCIKYKIQILDNENYKYIIRNMDYNIYDN